MEKIDIPLTYAEINDAIAKEDYEKVLILSEKILKVDHKEKEAFQCKIISLINLSRYDEIIGIIEKLPSLEKELVLEYAYALHEKKKYSESNNILNQYSNRKEILTSINELKAQNFYKMGNFIDSFKIYKELIENKNNLEDEKDLISNFLAAYIFSNTKDEKLLNSIVKYLNTWESFYNYCIICLKEGKFNETMETLNRIRRDYPTNGEEFNELKNLNLNLNLIQTSFEGFDYSKYTNIIDEYELYFNSGKHTELLPYFYNNFLHVKKDKDPINETLRKLENLLKNENLMQEEKQRLVMNKMILLLRANRMNEASDIFKTLKHVDTTLMTIVYCYIQLKQEKLERYEEFLKSDSYVQHKPESHLILIQMMLSSLNSKNTEQFHLKVLNFIKEFFEFTINFHFLNFFVGFYESRHMKDYLKEFVRNYKDIQVITKHLNLKDPKNFKKCCVLLGKSFYNAGLYEESANYLSYVIENIDRSDVNVKLELINSFAHINTIKCDEFRKQIDETMIDMSFENFNNLVQEVFIKTKKNQGDKKKSKKKNKKKRYPKNFDPKKPGPLPDPERWLPKLQRKKFRNIAKNKLAYQGATADNTVTSTQFGKK